MVNHFRNKYSMNVTITFKTTDGKNHRYKLKTADELSGISRKRKAVFVFIYGVHICVGYSDGEIDESGCFSIKEKPESPSMGFVSPVNNLLGWAYLREKKGGAA